MNKKIFIVGLIIACLLLFGCQEKFVPADDSQATPEGVSAVVNANNQFAFELYSRYRDQGNVFFSPYSISTAVAMTYEGGQGQTAEEIQKVFHFPEDNLLRRSAFARLYNSINKKDKEYQLSTANALWAQKDYQFLEEYTNKIKNYYGGQVINLDFVQQPQESRKIINDWVEEQTNNRIKDLIPPSAINSLTRLILTNAVYFKGEWVLKFDKKKTRDSDFRVSPGKTVQVPMMSLTGEKARFNYAETEELQILELPYQGEELSMLILLPKEDNLLSLEESLSAEKLEVLKSMMAERKIDVFLPRFKFEKKYFMAGDLAEMGMPKAFQWPGADFSGMDGTQNFYISSIIHQAFVEVNEEGTEAAAATAIIMTMGAVMSDTFRADHPFIFIIQQKDTGSILFLGKVTDPTQSE